MINQQVLEGHWQEVRGKIREKWGQITENDVQKFDGNVDQLIGTIQRKTGESREAIANFLQDLSEEGSSALAAAGETIRGYARQTGQAMSNAYDNVSQRLREGYAGAEEMVQRYPTRSVGVAFGAGLLLGVVVGLLTRSR